MAERSPYRNQLTKKAQNLKDYGVCVNHAPSSFNQLTAFSKKRRRDKRMKSQAQGILHMRDVLEEEFLVHYQRTLHKVGQRHNLSNEIEKQLEQQLET
jgi:hypothetical protein